MCTGEHLLYLFDQRAHVEAGEGGLLGRLQDQCVPATKSWPQLPRRHHQWEVPLRKQSAEKLSPMLSLFEWPLLLYTACSITPKAADTLKCLWGSCTGKEELLPAWKSFKCHLFLFNELEDVCHKIFLFTCKWIKHMIYVSL